ncbi:MAG: hypothetical protein ACSW73_00330 [Spirochaetales bacterium]
MKRKIPRYPMTETSVQNEFNSIEEQITQTLEKLNPEVIEASKNADPDRDSAFLYQYYVPWFSPEFKETETYKEIRKTIGSSVPAGRVYEYFMDSANVGNELLAEQKRRVTEMIEIEKTLAARLLKLKESLNEIRPLVKALNNPLLDDKAKSALCFFESMLKISRAQGNIDKKDIPSVLANAGYCTYALLGGEARQISINEFKNTKGTKS